METQELNSVLLNWKHFIKPKTNLIFSIPSRALDSKQKNRLIESVTHSQVAGCHLWYVNHLHRPQSSSIICHFTFANFFAGSFYLWPTFECGSSSRVRHTKQQYEKKGLKRVALIVIDGMRVGGKLAPLNYVPNMKANKQTNKIRSWIDCCTAQYSGFLHNWRS